VPESGHNLEIVETQARSEASDPAVKERKASKHVKRADRFGLPSLFG
jgi:hypothetical protein